MAVDAQKPRVSGASGNVELQTTAISTTTNLLNEPL